MLILSLSEHEQLPGGDWGGNMLLWLRVWFMGFLESRGDIGMSWEDADMNSRLNRAYDLGRAFGRKTIARGFDEREC